MSSLNSFQAQSDLVVGGETFTIYRLDALPGTQRLPFTHKVLLENLLRTEDGANQLSERLSELESSKNFIHI